MTKVMTLIVAVENIKNLDDTFTVTNEIIDPLIEEEASRAGFDPGEKVTVRDLLYAAMFTLRRRRNDRTCGLCCRQRARVR